MIKMLKVKEICFLIIIIFNSNCLSSTFNERPSMVYRELWEAENIQTEIARSLKLLENIVVHETSGPTCNDSQSCSKILKDLQQKDIPIKDDIRYNFLVGGDGQIYEGRGWYQVGAAVNEFDHLCISIAFIGTFQDSYPTVDSWKAFLNLLEYGVDFKFIAKDYSVMTYQQHENIEQKYLKNSLNFTENYLYQLIKKLPNWSNLTNI